MSGHQKKKSIWPLFCLSLIIWICVVVLGIYIALSCTHNNDVYIAQVHSNDTTPIHVRFGYFGICTSVGGVGNETNHNPLEADSDANTACLSRMDIDEDRSLADQFMAKLADADSDSPPADTAPDKLDDILQLAISLQDNVFPAAVPMAFFCFFVLTSFVFWILVVLRARTAAYKTCFAITALVNSYGLSLGFMAAWGTRQAIKSLIIPAESADVGLLLPGVYVSESFKLQAIQWSLVGLCCVLQFVIAGMFIQRNAASHAAGHDVAITLMPPIFALGGYSYSAVGAGGRKKKKKRCCC